uniref:Uncharacterized protein n=1 Tax=Anguilla anguilla TaxID=7936 RepID=A0A0E9T5B3_ANGAN
MLSFGQTHSGKAYYSEPIIIISSSLNEHLMGELMFRVTHKGL